MLHSIVQWILIFCELIFAASIIIVRVVDRNKSQEFFQDKKVLAFIWVAAASIGAIVFLKQLFFP